MMMELPSDKNNANGSLHPFMYPADLRVLGYATAAASVLPVSSAAQFQLMSPTLQSNGISSGVSNEFLLPRSLLFSEAEVGSELRLLVY